jgi:Na+/proline symporter
MDFASGSGFLLIAAAIVVLGLVIFFFGDRLRPLKGTERKRSEEAARQNWGKEEIH